MVDFRATPPGLFTRRRTLGVRGSWTKIASKTCSDSTAVVGSSHWFQVIVPANAAGNGVVAGRRTARAWLAIGSIREMVPDERARTRPEALTEVTSTWTSAAGWLEGLAIRAKARKPLGDAEAPTFSTTRAGGGPLDGVALAEAIGTADRVAAGVALGGWADDVQEASATAAATSAISARRVLNRPPPPCC